MTDLNRIAGYRRALLYDGTMIDENGAAVSMLNPITRTEIQISPSFSGPNGGLTHLERFVNAMCQAAWGIDAGDDWRLYCDVTRVEGINGWDTAPGEVAVTFRLGGAFVGRTDASTGCRSCGGAGWTCEQHEVRYDESHRAACPGPGTACQACNPAGTVTTWREVITSVANDE